MATLKQKVEETARNIGSDCPSVVARKQNDTVLLSEAEKLTIWQQADDEWKAGMRELKRIFPNLTAYRSEK